MWGHSQQLEFWVVDCRLFGFQLSLLVVDGII